MATALDQAHAAMMASGEDAARLAFWGLVADSPLLMLLETEAVGEVLTPRIFDLSDGPMILAFDTEERMAEFTGGVSAYARLPGRVIAAQLAGQGIGLALNLGAPSQMILPPDVMDWLVELLAEEPGQAIAKPRAFLPLGPLPAALLSGLEARIAPTGDLAVGAVLAGVEYADGRRGHLLAFLDAKPEAEAALARAVSEALTFSGVDLGQIDVAFLASGASAARQMARVGRRFTPIRTAPQDRPAPIPPGTDPTKPPRLR